MKIFSNIGDPIGYIEKTDDKWHLTESKVKKITLCKNSEVHVYVQYFHWFQDSEIKTNTEIMRESQVALLRHPFILDETTRMNAERWINDANQHSE